MGSVFFSVLTEEIQPTIVPFFLSVMELVPLLGCMEKNLSSAIAATSSANTPAAFMTILGYILPLLVSTEMILPSLTSMAVTAVLREMPAPFAAAFSPKAIVSPYGQTHPAMGL